jgi:hypothetical protein
LQVQVIHIQASHFPYPQTTAQHEGEHGFVTGRLDDGKQRFQDLILDIAGQAATLADVVALGQHWITRGIGYGQVEEAIKGSQCGQPPVDGSRGVALYLALLDKGIYISCADFGDSFVTRVEKQFDIVGVMNMGGSVGTPAAEPLLETDNFG